MPATDAAILTKARAMTGQLLTDADYAELSRHTSVSDAAAWLAAKPAYSELFADADLSDINRSRLEFKLECSLIDRILRLYRYATGSSREYLAYLLEEYELRYLMIILRRVLSQADSETDAAPLSESVLMIPQNLVNYSHIDFSALMASRDTGEFIALVKNTPYHNILAPLLADENKRSDFSLIETALYNCRRDRLYRAVSAMKNGGMTLLADSLDRLSDYYNARCALRLRKFNEASGIQTDMKPYLANGGTKRCRRELGRITDASDDKSARSAALRLLRGEDEGFLQRNAMTLLRRSPGISLAPVFGYLALADAETRKIIGITEMIRYSR